MIKKYYYLAKPGIIYGNILTTAAGFFLASKNHFDFWLLVATVVGLSFVMACGCVLNNIFDRKIDAQMDRTKNRALVTGTVSKRNALIYAAVLGILGFKILYLFTNPLTTLVALVGFIVYVFIYTPLKPRTMYGTLLGSISGAVPPVVGYCAVSNNFDAGAVLLFLTLVVWQMPHFYSIAIYRFNDYKSASIPVLPVKKGLYVTKIQILLYIVAFIIVSGLFTVYGFTGYVYLGIMAVIGFYWLWKALAGFRKKNDDSVWARKMFRLSLIVLLTFSIAISISGIINL